LEDYLLKSNLELTKIINIKKFENCKKSKMEIFDFFVFISETNKRKGLKPPVMNWYELGIKPPRLGEKQSDETKEKIRKVRKGKTLEEIFKDTEYFKK
jgi:hypothetical protein